MPVVKVTTAIKLSSAQQAKLEKVWQAKMGAAETQFTYEVEPHILGGVKVTLGSRELDGTLRAKLAQIHERLAANI